MRNDKKIKKMNKLEIIENILIYLIYTFSILIIVGILISIKSKNIAFWLTSISSGLLFFSIFILIIIIFLKEFKKLNK